MDEAEDEVIDVLSPQDEFPRRPEPALGAGGAITPVDGEEEDEAQQAARLVLAARDWADAMPDGDDWEEFFISIDLLEEPIEEDTS